MHGSRVLIALMIVCAIAFGVRFSDMIAKLTMTDAYAATSAADRMSGFEPSAGEAAPPSQDKLQKPSDATSSPVDVKPSNGKPEIEPPSMEPVPQTGTSAAAKPAAKEEWKGADDLDDQYEDVKMEMFSDLSKRRKDLEVKERELVMREALLKAAQAELVQKTDELTNIKTDIEALLKQQNELEDKRIASLVKIYEGMKAKDAARIFDSLDMDVLLQVMTRMSERKSAPIIAAMNEEKARNVTIMLAEQNKMPSLPELPITNQ